jgi:glucose-6-phosphate isomerase
VFGDLSKNLMDVATEQALLEMARQSGLEQHRDAMFAGVRINTHRRPFR